jgi:trehalose-6-phosphatase
VQRWTDVSADEKQMRGAEGIRIESGRCGIECHWRRMNQDSAEKNETTVQLSLTSQ